MSMTFTVSPRPEPSGMVLLFWCDADPAEVAPGDASVLAAEHDAACGFCSGYGGVLSEPTFPFEEINLANGNAYELLELAGLPAEPAGSISGEELLGRLLLADALLDEQPARPWSADVQPGRATLIDVGRPAGYMNGRVRQLAEIARWAASAGADVVWG